MQARSPRRAGTSRDEPLLLNARDRIKVRDLDAIDAPATSAPRPELERLSDEELLAAVTNPLGDDPIVINARTGKVYDGNGRARELRRRASDPNSSITWDTAIPYELYTPDTSMFWDLP
jgi:hypothetical protein